jgi:hypothetical protein
VTLVTMRARVTPTEGTTACVTKRFRNMTWNEQLSDVFGGMVNQNTLEHAAEMMVDVSEDDEDVHAQYIDLCSVAIAECSAGNDDVLAAINKFGVQATDLGAAWKLIEELKESYVREYESRVG